MEKLNRIKGALADAGKTNLWLAERVERDPVTVSKGEVHRARCERLRI